MNNLKQYDEARIRFNKWLINLTDLVEKYNLTK